MNELQVYEAKQFLVEDAENGGYRISSPLMDGKAVVLKRSSIVVDDGRERDLCDQDFGKVGNSTKPSLLKAGAEKIANACGLLQHYEIVSSIEEYKDEPFFMYTVKCELCKVSNDGKEYVFYSMYGSANTREKRNGGKGAFDGANATLKMAQKRAFVGAVLSLGGISDMFTQDLDDENNEKKTKELASQKADAPITKQQWNRIFAVAKDNGFGKDEAVAKLKELGFAKASEINQKAYREVVMPAFEGEK